MICKVGICGASGRMGLEIAAAIQQGFQFRDTSFRFCDAIAESNRISSVEGIPVRSFLDVSSEPVHIWIDFSRPEATLELLKKIQTPIVIGTTGFSESQWKEVAHYAEKRPVLFAPNMAPGMNALLRILDSGLLPSTMGFNVLAGESHHKHKKDSPSGTMKRLISSLELQGYRNIPVEVSRVGEVLGVHRLQFVSEDEEIKIEHRVLNRRVFANGALVGAQFLMAQTAPKIYSYEEVLVS